MDNASIPLVSVCMPLYNTERYVAEAIEGVLNQSHTHLELVICDNGSTDRSLEIVESYAAHDPRIRLVRNRRNLGFAGNLHKVTSLATGEFMMVHCADDVSAPDAIKKMVIAATSSPVDRSNAVIIADSYVTDGAGKPTGVHRRRPSGFDLAFASLDDYRSSCEFAHFKGKEALAYALPRLTIVGWLGATMYSRSLFESIEGVYNGLLYTPDLQLNYHLLSRDPDVVWINEPLFFWRLHEAGQIGQARAQSIPRHAWDGYTYTFHFSSAFLKDVGVEHGDIIRAFIDGLCLRKALEEIRCGSNLLAFRHLCLALGTYPAATLRNPKFYIAALGVLTGPVGKLLARAGYNAGVWRRRIPTP